jgi:uncharacterized protein (TIGR02001 family)
MKKFLLLSAAVFTVSVPAYAAEDSLPGEFSTTVGFVSEYASRGLTQSDEHPAVQGSIDWNHDSGFYAGVWGSNVDFNDGDEANVELDFYAGYSGEVAGFAYDIGALYYLYPGADDDFDYDYYEGAFSLGYDFDIFSISGAVNYAPDNAANSGNATYVASYVDVPLPFMPFDTTLNGSAGHQWIEDNDAFGLEDYTDWSFGISSNIEGFDVGLKYIDTNLDEPDECADGCGERVVFSVSLTLP